MYVSEIDPFNYQMAIKNVEQNQLQDRIHGKAKHISFDFNKKKIISSNTNGFIRII